MDKLKKDKLLELIKKYGIDCIAQGHCSVTNLYAELIYIDKNKKLLGEIKSFLEIK